MTAQLDRMCEDIGRDPGSIGRSVGVIVEPGDAKVAESIGFGVAITGSVDQIVDAIAGVASVGVTRVELLVPEHGRHPRATRPGSYSARLSNRRKDPASRAVATQDARADLPMRRNHDALSTAHLDRCWR